MKCPRRRTIVEIEKGRTIEDFMICIGGECEWWDDTLKLCSVRVLAQFMVGIGVNIHNIAENMPFKAQL